VIAAQGLTKHYENLSGDPFVAVDGVSFEVAPGEIFGLLGANGAGKTTCLRMLGTVLQPTAGTATIAGFDVVTQAAEVRAHIGYMSGNTGIYDRMTPWEFVEYYGRLHGVPRATLRPRMESLFDRLQMNDFRKTPGAQLSTGMRQKTSIARALVHDPPVVIFDEPTSGLDVLVARSLLGIIADLRREGRSVVFSTHIMSEVKRLCDRVAIVHRGRVLAAGTVADLTREHGQPDFEELFFELVSGSERASGSQRASGSASADGVLANSSATGPEALS
jgi:sodium transport system ATP-binding protein